MRLTMFFFKIQCMWCSQSLHYKGVVYSNPLPCNCEYVHNICKINGHHFNLCKTGKCWNKNIETGQPKVLGFFEGFGTLVALLPRLWLVGDSRLNLFVPLSQPVFPLQHALIQLPDPRRVRISEMPFRRAGGIMCHPPPHSEHLSRWSG